MIVDRKIFFDGVRASLFGGSLSTSQVEGMEEILACWEKTYRTLELRFIAYSLATVFHETNKTMQPIEEYGRGIGHPYGQPNGPREQTYYGRGYVQLTWYTNYEKAQNLLTKLGLIGPDIDIVKNPDLAMRPDIAVKILVIGMMQGWFTTKRLPEYFNQIANDPVGARRIINGADRANLIAVYYGKFLAAITLINVPLPVPVPQITPTPPVPVPAPLPPKPQTPLPAPLARPALSLWARLLAFLKPRPVGNRLIGDVSIMNGSKTFMFSSAGIMSVLFTAVSSMATTGNIQMMIAIFGTTIAAALLFMAQMASRSAIGKLGLTIADQIAVALEGNSNALVAAVAKLADEAIRKAQAEATAAATTAAVAATAAATTATAATQAVKAT